MGRELLAQEPVFRRAVEEVSDLFARARRLVAAGQADRRREQLAKSSETRVGQPAIFALQVGLAALWRSWGVEPAAVFGHSAGEMAASYIAGALVAGGCRSVTFHRSRLQCGEPPGRARCWRRGFPARRRRAWSHATRVPFRSRPSTAPRSVTLSGDAAVLAEIDKTLNDAGRVQPRLAGGRAVSTARRWSSSRAELLECLRDIRPLPASMPFFSTVTGTAVDRTGGGCAVLVPQRRGSRCCSPTSWKADQGGASGVPGDRRASRC